MIKTAYIRLKRKAKPMDKEDFYKWLETCPTHEWETSEMCEIENYVQVTFKLLESDDD